MVESPSFEELQYDVEHRLRRLEDAVAALQDTQIVEERIVERLGQRLKRSQAKALPEAGTVVVDATTDGSYGDDNGPAEERAAPKPRSWSGAGSWFVFDLWGEVRTYIRMFFDHRYRVSMVGRLGPVVIAGLYLFTMLFVGYMPLIGGILERAIDIVLAIVLYKVCAREVHRYRQMFPER